MGRLGDQLMTATERSVALAQLDERYGKLRLQRPELVAGIRRSIEREGLLHPLVVNQLRDGTLAVLDGFKRLQVLRELGHDDVLVRVVELEDATARAALLVYNVPHGGLSEIEEAWIVRSLVRHCKLTQKAVAELISRHKSWVCRRLQLAERLDPNIQEDMRLGLCSATVAREVVRLPRGNQAQVAQVVRKHGLTSRQCAALVDRCLTCDEPSTLKEVLDDPLRFITDRQSPEHHRTRDPRLSTRADALRHRMVHLEKAALEVCQVLRQHPPAALDSDDLSVLCTFARAAHERSTEATAQLAQLDEAAAGRPSG